jgi:hypothetical protein
VTREGDRTALRLLLAGALAGVVAGVFAAHLAAAPDAALPPDVLARVGGRPILRDDLARSVAGLASDRRDPETERERARAFGRLVDEELLAQHALATGVLTSERAVRDVVVRVMVDAAVADAIARAPSEEELRAFWEERWDASGGGGAGNGGANADGRGAAEAAFAAARPAIERAFAERARDEAIRSYLAELRVAARIEIAPAEAR